MSFRSLTLLAIAAGTASTLAAEDGPTTPDLLRRIDELDQRIRILDRKAEIAAEESSAKAKTAIVAKAGDDGFSLGTADGAYQLKFGVLVQADGRFFLNDGDSREVYGTPSVATEQANTFLIRRAQTTIDAKLGAYTTARLQTNITGTATAGIQEGWLQVKPGDAFWTRIGRIKTLGVEYQANTAGLTFAERGLPTNLVPQYDIGATIGGGIGRIANWSLGVVNGAPDGGTRDTDNDDDKDGFGVIALTPFAGDADSPLNGLKLTLGGSYGYETGAGTAGNASLTAGYKSPGQVTVFSYNAATTAAPSSGAYGYGSRRRFAPALEWYSGPVGILAEYTVSSQDIARGTHRESVDNRAWQGTASYVLTGEKKTSNVIVPRQAFDPATGSWGAWEVAARAGELVIDDAAFEGFGANPAAIAASRFADPTKSVRKAANVGLGINWWLTRNLKWQLSYDYTRFTGGGGGTATDPIDRESEQVVITRAQINY